MPQITELPQFQCGGCSTALARCSADASLLHFCLRCSSARCTRFGLGALAGDYGMQVMTPHLATVASEHAGFTRPRRCAHLQPSTRREADPDASRRGGGGRPYILSDRRQLYPPPTDRRGTAGRRNRGDTHQETVAERAAKSFGRRQQLRFHTAWNSAARRPVAVFPSDKRPRLAGARIAVAVPLFP